jgi:GNAT superfamily N-acetyltransferase
MSIVCSADYKLSFLHSNQLNADLRRNLFALFETNMKALYVASACILLACVRATAHRYESSADGYDDDAKREELFHADARFACAWTSDASPRLTGYAIWRFDMDGDDEDELPVVYWCVASGARRITLMVPSYEVQVEAKASGKGLGRHLMGILASLARAYQLSKVVLTVFKGACCCLLWSQIPISARSQSHCSCLL